MCRQAWLAIQARFDSIPCSQSLKRVPAGLPATLEALRQRYPFPARSGRGPKNHAIIVAKFRMSCRPESVQRRLDRGGEGSLEVWMLAVTTA